MAPTGGALIAQAPPPQVRHATYDFTEGAADPNLGLEEVWVDSKSPGDGMTYSVGTIEVIQTDGPGVTFSGAPIFNAGGLFGFQALQPGIAEKQVVVVQAVDAQQQIQWQRFYYGFPEPGGDFTNARAISVWPASSAADTRIAICGESTHDNLPLDQGEVFATGFTKGFVAVFDGDGAHLWSHQFFGRSPLGNPVGDVAVTDLSIRVEDGDDVVTYCGMTDIGTTGLDATSMQPVQPFVSVPAWTTCTPSASFAIGDTDTSGSWDGFVGRIRFSSIGQRTIEFHSSVGADVTDGLFGIAEITPERFVVVGSTGRDISGQAGSSGTVFPFSDGTCNQAPAGTYRYGTVMEFDATATPTGNLVLNWSQRLGVVSEPGRFTSARDVVVKPGFAPSAIGPLPLVVVVGQTDDADLVSIPGLGGSCINGFGPQATIGGGEDGFVITAYSYGSSGPWGPCHATYRGGAGDDALTGVQSWNEFFDHFAVVGYFDDQDADETGVAADIEVSSYWINTSGDTSNPPLVEARRAVVGAADSYQPAALGAQNMGFEYLQGGGIAVDDTGRVTVAGAYTFANPPSVPYASTGVEPTVVAGRNNTYPNEAYRAVLDMLPNSSGRTDGTGIPVPAPGTQYPLAGVYGGSTPECALRPFGNLVGQSSSSPRLSRMLIDYIAPGPQVDPTAGDQMTLVVDRPPGVSIQVAAWQLGFPGSIGGGAPTPLPLPEGVILWTVDNPVTYVFASTASLSQTWMLPTMTSATLTAQLYCLLDPADAIPGGALGPVCTGTSTTAASPALWFTF